MQHRLHIRPARHYAPPSLRNRVRYGVLAVAVVAAGLLWRSGFIPLPPVLSKYGGDALWALVVFVGFGLVLPRASTFVVALLALTFSWGVEFSQLYRASVETTMIYLHVMKRPGAGGPSPLDLS